MVSARTVFKRALLVPAIMLVLICTFFLLVYLDEQKHASRAAYVLWQLENIPPTTARDVAVFHLFAKRDVLRRCQKKIDAALKKWRQENGFRGWSKTEYMTYPNFTLQRTTVVKN